MLRDLRVRIQRLRNHWRPSELTSDELKEILESCLSGADSEAHEAIWLLEVVPSYLIPNDVIKAVFARLQSADERVSRSAAGCLLALGIDAFNCDFSVADLLGEKRSLPDAVVPYLVGAAWTVFGHAESLHEVTGFLHCNRKEVTISELRTIHQIGSATRAVTPRLLKLAQTATGDVQKLSIRALGEVSRIDDVQDTLARLRANKVYLQEIDTALQRLSTRRLACVQDRYCANVPGIEFTPEESAARPEFVKKLTAHIDRLEKDSRRRIADVINEAWANSRGDVEFRHGVTTLAQQKGVQLVEETHQETQTALSVDTELADIPIDSREMLEVPHSEVVGTLGFLSKIHDSISAEHCAKFGPSVSEVNHMFRLMESKRLEHEIADQFVVLVRRIAEMLDSELFFDGYPVNISVQRDRRRYARFALQELRNSKKQRRKAVSSLPKLELRRKKLSKALTGVD